MTNTKTQKFDQFDPVKVKSNSYNSKGIIVDVDIHLQECKVKCIDAKISWFKFSELEHMKEMDIEIDCENCESGIVEGELYCFQPASSCCGGCAGNPENCDDCDGSGKINICISDFIENIDIFEAH